MTEKETTLTQQLSTIGHFIERAGKHINYGRNPGTKIHYAGSLLTYEFNVKREYTYKGTSYIVIGKYTSYAGGIRNVNQKLDLFN